jgi:hypothetical protein
MNDGPENPNGIIAIYEAAFLVIITGFAFFYIVKVCDL